MLKIKDNVDLKELEKYGFKITRFNEFRKYYNKEENDIDYFIWEDTRIIEINSNNYDREIGNLLYDLIKAGLVEKVEE